MVGVAAHYKCIHTTAQVANKNSDKRLTWSGGWWLGAHNASDGINGYSEWRRNDSVRWCKRRLLRTRRNKNSMEAVVSISAFSVYWTGWSMTLTFDLLTLCCSKLQNHAPIAHPNQFKNASLKMSSATYGFENLSIRGSSLDCIGNVYIRFGQNPFIGSRNTEFTRSLLTLSDLDLWTNGLLNICLLYTSDAADE